ASLNRASSPETSLCLSISGKGHAFDYECRRRHSKVPVNIGRRRHIEEHVLEVRSNRHFAYRIGKFPIFDPEARRATAVLAANHVHALPEHFRYVKACADG